MSWQILDATSLTTTTPIPLREKSPIPKYFVIFDKIKFLGHLSQVPEDWTDRVGL